ncbi:hypothetical protein TNIN_322261 [Trichonephila inaurata madagascariensis]|uniref:Uncharacterized protein n=1 Tax=Trichonephila inaurata madagascariensis TaxID=2747483 RepID=A0A8X6XAC6_9ARAC|nr:hypothetical protein TNIN_322261 [Trichonephila inaurata madagascariensis]
MLTYLKFKEFRMKSNVVFEAGYQRTRIRSVASVLNSNKAFLSVTNNIILVNWQNFRRIFSESDIVPRLS